MAEENDEQEEGSGGGKKKLIIMAAAGFAVVLVIVLTAWFFLGSDEQPANDSADNGSAGAPQASVDTSEAPEVGNALYVGMPRAFVFMVPGDARERTVQIKVQLMVRGENSEELAKRHIPLIEGTLHEVFSSSTAEELKTVEGKVKLRELARQRVREALLEVTGKRLVEQVLFTGMVMQ